MEAYQHFNIREREKLLELKSKGKSYREIGRELKRCHSSIIREIRRNQNEIEYSPSEAEKQYIQRRKSSVKKCIIESNPELREYIEFKLEEEWLPDEISNRAKLENLHEVSTSTIYRGIEKGIIKIDKEKYLKFKGRKKKEKTAEKRGQIPERKFIEERSEKANNREEAGHWEADLVISKGRKNGLLTLLDRKSRFPIVVKVENKAKETITKAINKIFSMLPKNRVKSLTVDNGKEFAGFKEIEKEQRIEVYFCNPYSPWEKGSNENFNGILRQYYPKGTDFSEIPLNEIERIVKLIRNRPRKVLGYKTANEIFWENI